MKDYSAFAVITADNYYAARRALGEMAREADFSTNEELLAEYDALDARLDEYDKKNK